MSQTVEMEKIVAFCKRRGFVYQSSEIYGGILAVLVPLVPLLLVAFLLFFFYRVRKRRGRKFGGLRILGD